MLGYAPCTHKRTLCPPHTTHTSFLSHSHVNAFSHTQTRNVLSSLPHTNRFTHSHALSSLPSLSSLSTYPSFSLSTRNISAAWKLMFGKLFYFSREKKLSNSRKKKRKRRRRRAQNKPTSIIKEISPLLKLFHLLRRFKSRFSFSFDLFCSFFHHGHIQWKLLFIVMTIFSTIYNHDQRVSLNFAFLPQEGTN